MTKALLHTPNIYKIIRFLLKDEYNRLHHFRINKEHTIKSV